MRLVVLAVVWLLISHAEVAAQSLDSLSLEALLDVQIETASKYEQRVSEAPASVTIISAEEIEQHGYTSLAEALNSVAGFYLAHDHVRFSMGTRGFNRPQDYNNRMLVLVNGHAANESLYGAAFFDRGQGINLDLVERIEVVRGPGSVLYGTGAMFAVINVVTKSAADQSGGGVRVSGGTYGERGVQASMLADLNPRMRLTAGMQSRGTNSLDRYYPEFDTPEQNNGVAEGLDWDARRNAYVSLQYDQWELQAMWFASEAGVPNADLTSRFNPEEGLFQTERITVDLKRSDDLSPVAQLHTRAFYSRDELNSELSYGINLQQAGFGGNGNLNGTNLQQVEGTTAGIEVNLNWDVWSFFRMIVGTQFHHTYNASLRSTFAVTGGGLSIPFFTGSFDRNLWSVYAQAEYQLLPTLALTGGLRQDLYATNLLYSPRLAAVYHPHPTTTFKLLYGTAFREPSVLERTFESDIVGLISNADIQPERIRTTELIWEQHLSTRFSTSIALYDYAIRDLINAGSATENMSQFQNLGSVEARGGEIGITSRPMPDHEVGGSYSYQWAQQTHPTSSGTAYNAPHHLIKLQWRYTGWSWGTLAMEGFGESGRETARGTPTKRVFLLNTHLRTRPIWYGFVLSMHVHNVLDHTYTLPAGRQHEQDHFVQDGRRVTVGLAFTF